MVTLSQLSEDQYLTNCVRPSFVSFSLKQLYIENLTKGRTKGEKKERLCSATSMTSLTPAGEAIPLLEELLAVCTSVIEKTSVSAITMLNHWLYQLPAMPKLSS